MAKLVPDEFGNYKWIDLHPGDLISDQFGNWKLYDPNENTHLRTYTTNHIITNNNEQLL